MTLEEKRRSLSRYCERTDCNGCILTARKWTSPISPDDCLDIGVSPEADIDKALALIDGEERDCCTCRYFGMEHDDVECVGCRHHTPWDDPEYAYKPLKWVEADGCVAEDIPANDPVNHPNHYTSGGIECIDAIAASMTPIEYAGFLKGQVLKYVWRYRLKGKLVEDLKKARFYLDRLIQFSEKEEVAV